MNRREWLKRTAGVVIAASAAPFLPPLEATGGELETLDTTRFNVFDRHHIGRDGERYVLVRAREPIVVGQVVAWADDESVGPMRGPTIDRMLGVSSADARAGEYLWVQTSGRTWVLTA